MMRGLQTVEKKNAEFTDMLGVGLIAIQAARESSGAGNDLAGRSVVAVRFFSGESVVGDFLENAFTNANRGNGHGADIEISAESQERDGGDAHDVGAVAAHRVSLHALADTAPQDVGQAVTQKRKLQHGEAVFTRAWGDASQRSRIAPKRDGVFFAEFGGAG